ncbi:MAG: PLP-dependent aminotransferase family protein [Janthinobacterium lividum]
MSRLPASKQIPRPLESPQLTLVEQLFQWGQRRIQERVFRPGMRMPSIRQMAVEQGVSRFTVVEAYERLVAHGYLESRRGAGFFVREQQNAPQPQPARTTVPTTIDVAWLMRNILQTTEPERGPGLGYLPNRWLDGDMLSLGLRAIARQSGAQLLSYAHPQGFLPLRQQLQTRLAEIEIGAPPEQIVLLSGITQAVDLIARCYLQSGDAVIVGDPAWFQMFGTLTRHDVNLLGMPYTPAGPDLDALEVLVETWRPRLMIINSVLHNPTGTSLSAAQAFRILQLAERYDFLVVEDDIYGDLCPASQAFTRIASLDQLRRVIYLGSFSKTLAANLRVAYAACAPGIAKMLADQKILLTLTTPETNERLVYKVLTEGHYRRHVERLRQRLDTVREPTARLLQRLGLKLFCEPPAGMFLWADAGVDTAALTVRAHEENFLLAPGSLFSPHQSPSTWMRFNIANCGDPALEAFLAKNLGKNPDNAGARRAGP